jgi:DnaJ-class molecular chaperone
MVRKVVWRTRCQNCNGKGFNAEVCDKCNGNGLITCVTCEGDGKVDCKICGGTGDYKGPCPECVGKYKRVLQEILTLNRFSKWKELVQKELDNLQKVKKKKKEK